ncbi:MAG TPA: hypothetical protein VMG41_09660 [Gemmatimonadales bacterium]|nr:hypothetical protein [Gemmatimonadales bacterium]
MPLAFWIVPAIERVVVRGEGVISDREPVNLREALRADPRFVPSYWELLDLRAATDLALTHAGIVSVGTLNPYDPGVRRALVAVADSVYGMARMYQMARPPAPDQFEVFRDWNRALAWLQTNEKDLPPPHAPPDWSTPSWSGSGPAQ